ncbi:MAG: DNA repair protein RecN [Gemmatimonadetes bacterium]|nr:DNA repair protein RecN [Gemmatimonadota bacterium]
MYCRFEAAVARRATRVLTEIRVRDLAVIADVTLLLQPGLNVLTGETGAGKSLLVDALGLLLGERASSDVVRPGAQRAVVEAVFDLSGPAASSALSSLSAAAAEAGVELDDSRLIVRREVTAEGRSRVWVNGSPTTVGVLAGLSRIVVDLHGQHDAQSLLRPAGQRDMLDAFGDAEAEREAVRAAHRRESSLAERERALEVELAEARKQADYLRHVAEEIRGSAPRLGEDEELAIEARRLANVEELNRLVAQIATLVDGEEASAVDRVGQAHRAIEQLERIDPSVAAWRELLEQAAASLDEVARAVRDYEGAVEQDPERLEAVERRRDTLFRLKQKYGPTIEDVLHRGEQAAQALELVDTGDEALTRIVAERREAEQALAEAAGRLTLKRRRAALRLARGVDEHLPRLGMPGGKFTVSVTPADGIGPAGGDDVTFLVKLNVGLDARPLSDVASGGELSRLMLALKVVLARQDAVPTLVFDEVDQGVGGEVASQVGEALARVAEARQVLVITHLPQIAARARHHVVITKQPRGGVATADARPVEGEERVGEVARMLGDPDAPTARKHASELLRKAGLRLA